MPSAKPKIVVIGAGIIGASTAFHLAKSGARVELLDESELSNRATPASFGWINANTPTNKDYFCFRMNAIEHWRNLVAENPSLPVRFSGSIDWDMDDDEIEPTFKLYQELGYDSELIAPKEIEALVPSLNSAAEVAILNHCEGVTNPDLIADAFVELAKQHGATIRTSVKILELESIGNRISGVIGSSGRIECDYLVVCTGTQTDDLLSPLDIEVPLEKLTGMLARTSPVENLCECLVSMPDLHFWQMADGSLIAGETQAGDTKTTAIGELANLFQQRLAERLPGVRGLAIEKISTGTRPVPADGMPIVGITDQFSNLHLAVMHSGITLAPIMGKLIAREIITGHSENSLEDFRLARFNQSDNSLDHLTVAGASA